MHGCTKTPTVKRYLSPGTEFTGDCDSCDVAATNQTRVILWSSALQMLCHLSSSYFVYIYIILERSGKFT